MNPELSPALRAALIRLEAATEAICEKTCRVRPNFTTNAVNWANFHCVGTGVIARNGVGAWWCVEIAEASPESGSLANWIANELALAGWGGVEVRFEW